MSGVTKRIYQGEIRDIVKMWNKQLKHIAQVLPKDYEDDDIISELKRYYPYEWESVEIKYGYYKIKDKYIKKKTGKFRYEMESPEKLLLKCSMYRKLSSGLYKEKYKVNFSNEKLLLEKEKLWSTRKGKIDRITQKIDKAKSKTQQVTPDFLDQLIGLYERKNTTQKDKVYIILELKKYYTPKIIQFFFKLNDIELNRQLREIAFYHLQDFNYQPRLRKQKYMQVHVKNKRRKQYLKKEYPNKRYNIPENPEELEYRINNAKEQKIKSYDIFISHSSIDRTFIQKLISFENNQKKNVYCDWISDNDYLKRNLLCEATLNVLKVRLAQSEALLFVESENSLNSVWCKYELNYYLSLNKPIYVIKIEEIEKGSFRIRKMEDLWFKDPNYEQLAILSGKKIIS